MPLSEQVLGGFKTGMTRGSRRGGKEGAQKLWTLQNGWVNDQGDVVPRPGLQHVANVANSAGLYGADGQLHVFHSGEQGYINPNLPLVTDHILRYPLASVASTYDPNLTINRLLLLDPSDHTDYSAPGFDDSGWAQGLMPFGTVDRPGAAVYGFPSKVKTNWPLPKNAWFRGTFELESPTDQTLHIYLDDGATVYVNGVEVFSATTGEDEHYYWTQVIPAARFVAGTNVIAVYARGDIYGINNFVSFRLDGANSDDPAVGTLVVRKVYFVGLMLGRIYVAAEFANGVIRHYWLQEPANWSPNTIYGLGDLVQPLIHNGYYYQANTKGNSPAWAAGQPKSIGDVVQPTSPNGWEYVVTDSTGNAVTGDAEPAWPTSEGATVFEGTDTTTIPSDSTTAPSSGTNIGKDIKDRYGLFGADA